MVRAGWLWGCIWAVALGCGGTAAPAATPAKEPPTGSAKPPGRPATATTKASLRCGDFFNAQDGAALGLDASGYDADRTQTNPELGVLCSMGPVGFTLFHSDAYDSMIAGLDRGVQQGALQAADGPKVGIASRWSSMGPMQSAMFLSSSKRYAGHITAADKALIHKVALVLDAKMK